MVRFFTVFVRFSVVSTAALTPLTIIYRSVKSFAEKYGLHDPVAIAGWLAEYDPHCDTVYAHLK
jgi:hypothetical protein